MVIKGVPSTSARPRYRARLLSTSLLLAAALSAGLAARADDGSAAWLRYARIANPQQYAGLPARIVIYGNTPTDKAAAAELSRGLSSMLGRSFKVTEGSTNRPLPDANAITIASAAGIRGIFAPGVKEAASRSEQYRITARTISGRMQVGITSATPQGELYGVFHLLERIALQQPLAGDEMQSPAAPIRWTDEWDNLNGTIERGYAGRSIFFDNGHVRADLSRAGDYARLLASVGINGCNVNNVNADMDTLSPEHLREFARIADVFRPWGVKLALSVDLTSPQAIGGLDTFDPVDPKVIAWWQAKADEIYKFIPDFGGFTVKADSEGRKGPSQYGRTPADAANVLARALKPHGGVVLYRGFVYNNHLNWNDRKADRARAGVDNFVKNDGTFDANVIIQIKEGPIDFQAREPVSPLFAALHRTSVAIEVQTAQEYTGQQRHMVFLPSMWKWVLDTDLRAPDSHGSPRATPVKSIVTGHAFPNIDGTPRTSGFISVTNVGLDANWLHHPMAMANLYGFGRLAWNPDTSVDEIANTWSTMTWGSDAAIRATVPKMLLSSWQVYEGYTGPNGIGTLTNILGYHFGPGIESAERNGWGQWFRGEKDGIGMDRTSHGTGYAQQYPPELAAKYESPETTPEDLLLFFHHVPYDYRLQDGRTLVQFIYDTHYASALAAAEFVPQWKSLQGRIDPERYMQTLRLFEFQAGHAIVWRDAINNWFAKQSGIADTMHRVGNDAGRIEAESMKAEGYTPIDVNPWETASGGKAMVCHTADGCTLTAKVQQQTGRYNVAIQYYDMWRGVSRYDLLVDGQRVAQWSADDTLPPAQFDAAPDGQTATRFTAHGIALRPGATLTLRGIPDLRTELEHVMPAAEANSQLHPRDYREFAPVDYIVIGPDGNLTPQ